MNSNHRRMAALAAAVVLAATWGCGDGKPSVSTSSEEATVKGTIKINGKPVAKGEVTFDPANHLRKDAAPRTATIGDDGSYSITTLVGSNQIFVHSSAQPRKGRARAKAGAGDLPPIEFDVQPGDNTYHVDLSTGN